MSRIWICIQSWHAVMNVYPSSIDKLKYYYPYSSWIDTPLTQHELLLPFWLNCRLNLAREGVTPPIHDQQLSSLQWQWHGEVPQSIIYYHNYIRLPSITVSRLLLHLRKVAGSFETTERSRAFSFSVRFRAQYATYFERIGWTRSSHHSSQENDATVSSRQLEEVEGVVLMWF